MTRAVLIPSEDAGADDRRMALPDVVRALGREDDAVPEVAELPTASALVRGWIHVRDVLARGSDRWTLENALRFVATCVVVEAKRGISMFHAQRRIVSFGASDVAVVVHHALEEKGDTFARALADRVRSLAGAPR